MIAKLSQSKIDKIGQLKVVKLDTRDGFVECSDGSWLLIRFWRRAIGPYLHRKCSNKEVQKFIQYGQELVAG